MAKEPSLWLRNSSGLPMLAGSGHWIFFDFGNPASAETLVEGVVNMTKSGAVDGTFIDGCIHTPPNLDAKTKAAYQAAKPTTLRSIQDAVPGVVICGSNGGVMPGLRASQIQNWGKAKMWSSREIPMLQRAVSQGIMFEAHGACPVNASDQETINNIAAFLVAAGEYSYYMCGGWNSAKPTWFPIYDFPLGKPVSNATLGADGVWRRAFESGTTVSFDTHAERGTIDWASTPHAERGHGLDDTGVDNQLPYPWSWDSPGTHQLTWGTTAAVNCSTLDPHSSTNCSDSERDLEVMLTRDIVFVQGYDFARELQQDNWTPARKEIAALKAYRAKRNSPRPYAVLGYRGVVVGPPRLWNDTRYDGFWLTDSNGITHRGLWDFRNASARAYYISDALAQTNHSNADGLFVDTGDAVAANANLTVRARREIYNATARLWGELAAAANADASSEQIFLITPSLKNHLGRSVDGDDGHPRCNDTTPPLVVSVCVWPGKCRGGEGQGCLRLFGHACCSDGAPIVQECGLHSVRRGSDLRGCEFGGSNGAQVVGSSQTVQLSFARLRQGHCGLRRRRAHHHRPGRAWAGVLRRCTKLDTCL